jgi:hypothetical protein
VIDVVIAYLSLAVGLIAEGWRVGGIHAVIDTFFGVWILGMPLVLIYSLVATIVGEVRRR